MAPEYEYVMPDNENANVCRPLSLLNDSRRIQRLEKKPISPILQRSQEPLFLKRPSPRRSCWPRMINLCCNFVLFIMNHARRFVQTQQFHS